MAFVGSENFSATSLDENRELGILIADQTVIATLAQTFQQDWSSAQAA
jgi:phosphatidylserine/phosphatidylglycerophosphate/cardiolipin synthase-like enzyme